jgi:hypothetical protein
LTTAADWVIETEQHLTAGSRQELNKLNGAISTTTGGTGSMTLAFDLGSIKPGAELSVDLEDFHVWATPGQTVTVERGVNGTTPAAHADGSLVYVKPRSSKFSILRAINQSLLSMSSAGMYHMTTVEVTFNPNTAGYDLAGVTSIEDVYKVEYRVTGQTADWREVHEWSWDREANITDFASGFSLRLGQGQSGQAVRVHYKQPFVQFTALTDNVTTTLLPASAYDMPPVGAAARLVGPREVGRNYTGSQGDTRRAEEVPSRAVAASAADLWRLWDRRLGEELMDLAQRYPVRSTV